ncbi:serine/threonine-protein kinase/endoribonuclease ire-1-like isoform X1, partial [Clarias magur]
MAEARHNITTDATDFVDAMRDTLIQRVCLVMPLADALLQGNHINPESYANIQAEGTTQSQMRELYRSLNNEPSKAAFYEALKRYEGFLVRELEKKHRRQGSQRVDNKTNTKLKERWLKNSNKYRTKFQELIEDPDLKILGNGKLFLCTKSKYKIGSGAEGTQVYIGMRNDGTEVAVKRMVKDDNKQLKDEMNVLRDPRLEHKNIVRYLDFSEDQDFVYLCLQLCECDFEEYKKTRGLDQDALKKVMKDVLLGLQVLHNAQIIHRDLKPWNILIDVGGNARLADFGISRMINQDASTVHTSRAGTRGWEAAEILKGNTDGTHGYKTSTDIQVAGMVMYYILSGGKHPFGTGYETEENIRKGNYQLDETTDVEAKDLIEKMIAHEPKARLSINEAVEHPYFWDDKGRDGFLRDIGDKKPVQKYKEVDAKLQEALGKYARFSDWKSKIEEKCDPKLPDDLLGLLRFLRNRLVH